jgi:hypothetical protein
MLIPDGRPLSEPAGVLIDQTVCFPDSLYRAARQFTYRRARGWFEFPVTFSGTDLGGSPLSREDT